MVDLSRPVDLSLEDLLVDTKWMLIKKWWIAESMENGRRNGEKRWEEREKRWEDGRRNEEKRWEEREKREEKGGRKKGGRRGREETKGKRRREKGGRERRGGKRKEMEKIGNDERRRVTPPLPSLPHTSTLHNPPPLTLHTPHPHLPHKHLIDEDAKCPPVHLLPVAPPLDDLRSQVLWCPT